MVIETIDCLLPEKAAVLDGVHDYGGDCCPDDNSNAETHNSEIHATASILTNGTTYRLTTSATFIRSPGIEISQFQVGNASSQ